jgi:hypothetical protein
LRYRKKAGQAETAAFFASDKNHHLLFGVFWSLTTSLSRTWCRQKKVSVIYSPAIYCGINSAVFPSPRGICRGMLQAAIFD